MQLTKQPPNRPTAKVSQPTIPPLATRTIRKAITYHLRPIGGGIGVPEIDILRAWISGKEFEIVDSVRPWTKSTKGTITCARVLGLDKVGFYKKTSQRKAELLGTVFYQKDVPRRIMELQRQIDTARFMGISSLVPNPDDRELKENRRYI
jgi:hypothetical protein